MDLNGTEHEDGNEECPECWMGYPERCKCGGLIHGEFLETDFEDNVYVYWKCDKCGEDGTN